MTSTLVHTSTAVQGWDAFDRMVLRAASLRPAQTFDGLVGLLPEGISYHLVRTTLRDAMRAGLVESSRVHSTGPVIALGKTTTVYDLTAAGFIHVNSTGIRPADARAA
ncbi:hypothetical protein [Thermomonospora umbrina]|uniref:HxlR family transcriptional regulator n=1 Tax=Thermomonospora umbrina TaxID=111806 RepID=A0A3D9T516_9ACTN|nr:hypothetical protein [Thermomonospora umbrina]REF00336.1 hypothetical protein DFJ69_5868 [Thermomonospora umbrina]